MQMRGRAQARSREEAENRACAELSVCPARGAGPWARLPAQVCPWNQVSDPRPDSPSQGLGSLGPVSVALPWPRALARRGARASEIRGLGVWQKLCQTLTLLPQFAGTYVESPHSEAVSSWAPRLLGGTHRPQHTADEKGSPHSGSGGRPSSTPGSSPVGAPGSGGWPSSAPGPCRWVPLAVVGGRPAL